jgi:hypothetical protein
VSFRRHPHMLLSAPLAGGVETPALPCGWNLRHVRVHQLDAATIEYSSVACNRDQRRATAVIRYPDDPVFTGRDVSSRTSALCLPFGQYRRKPARRRTPIFLADESTRSMITTVEVFSFGDPTCRATFSN